MRLLLLLGALSLSACGTYKNAVLFKTGEEFSNDAFKSVLKEAQSNYVLRKFDVFNMEIFTNKGERITDPNGEFLRMGNAPQGTNLNNNPNFNPGIGMVGGTMSILRRYPIEEDGRAYLPVLGAVKLEGLKLYQADSLLSKLYGDTLTTKSGVYKDPYVLTQLLNRRAVLVGALGNRIIPLDNENMNLVEVVALAGNFDFRVRADRIRVVRNWDTKPVIQVIDLSTVQGLQAANLRIEPNDIIYIEPRRGLGRRESIGDISSILGIAGGIVGVISSTIISIFAIQNLGRQQ
jgi:polysaccharide biosynthesis/export protein